MPASDAKPERRPEAPVGPRMRRMPGWRLLRPCLLALALAAPACSLVSSTDGLSGEGPAADGAAGSGPAAGSGGASGGASAAAGSSPGVAQGAGGVAMGAGGAAGCGGAGGCVFDLQNDPTNCGTPGHDCLGGTCQAGVCQPALIVSEQQGTIGLAVNETHLFWTSHGTNSIWRSSLDGTNAAPIVSNEEVGLADIQYIAVRGNFIYWTDWGEGQGGRIMKAGLDGSSPKPVVEGQPQPTGIAVGEKEIYFTTYLEDGEVRSVPLTGGTVTPLIGPFNLPEGLALMGDLVFVAQNGGNEINWAPIGGGEPGSYASNVVVSPAGLASDGRLIYWANQGQDIIYGVDPLAPSPMPTLLALGTGFFTGVAADATAVYWVALSEGTIFRLAK